MKLTAILAAACLAAPLAADNAKPTSPKGGMTEQDKRFLESVRTMYLGTDKENKIIAKDIVWHVPGHNPVSGLYQGYEAYTKTMPGKMGPLSKWEFKVGNVMVNGEHVVATVHFIGERKGRKVDMDGAHIMRLNAQGQIAEGWGFAADQDALDAFFAD